MWNYSLLGCVNCWQCVRYTGQDRHETRFIPLFVNQVTEKQRKSKPLPGCVALSTAGPTGVSKSSGHTSFLRDKKYIWINSTEWVLLEMLIVVQSPIIHPKGSLPYAQEPAGCRTIRFLLAKSKMGKPEMSLTCSFIASVCVRPDYIS
jgi:hypothetical protein